MTQETSGFKDSRKPVPDGIPLRGPFLRSVAWLMSGTAIAQVIALGASPILSRLFTPDAFGALGVFAATLTVISVIAAWRYEWAIVLPSTDDEAANVACVAFVIVLGMTLITALTILVAGDVYGYALGGEALTNAIWLLPVALLGEGVFQVLNFWRTRRRAFSHLALARAMRSLGTAGAQIGAGLMRLGAIGLVAGQAIGIVVGAAALSLSLSRSDRNDLKEGSGVAGMRAAFIRYRDFGRYGAPQALVNALSQSAPPILLGVAFGSSVVGFYWFAHRVLQTPLYLVGQSVRQVYYQQASDVRSVGEPLLPLLRRTTLVLFGLGILPAVLMVSVGPWLFGVVFGQQWITGGEYARWLVPGLLASLVNVPSSALVPILELQAYLLIWDVLLFVSRVAAILIVALSGSPVAVIAAYTSVGVAFNIWLIWFVFRRARGIMGATAAP